VLVKVSIIQSVVGACNFEAGAGSEVVLEKVGSPQLFNFVEVLERLKELPPVRVLEL